MALHGHTIIELRDIKTGATQVVEKNNRVTGAVAEIFKPFGLYTSASGLFTTTSTGLKEYISSLFGGLVLYDTALGSDPSTMFAPASAHVTGCAGYKLTDAGDNPVRGNSNLLETDLDLSHGTAKLVYEFGTAQGNGTIASVCLSHQYAGHFCAERPIAAGSQTNTVSFRGADVTEKNYCEAIFPSTSYYSGPNGIVLEFDEENDCVLIAKLTTNSAPSLTINRVALMLREVSLFWQRGSQDSVHLKSRQTIDLTGLLQTTRRNNCFMSYDAAARKIYLVSTPGDSGTAINATDVVLEIDADTGVKKQYNITNQTGVKLESYSGYYYHNAIAFVQDGILYRKSYDTVSGGTYRYFAIPLADPGNVKEITTNGNDLSTLHFNCAGRIYGSNGISGSNVVLLNTDEKALCSIPFSYSYYQDRLLTPPVRGRHVMRVSNYGDESLSDAFGGRLIFLPNYLATINDLASPVVKTADKTMKITYILREGS